MKLNYMLISNPSSALKRDNDKRALFEVRSPIKIPSMPHLGIGQSLTLTVYSSRLT